MSSRVIVCAGKAVAVAAIVQCAGADAPFVPDMLKNSTCLAGT